MQSCFLEVPHRARRDYAKYTKYNPLDFLNIDLLLW